MNIYIFLNTDNDIKDAIYSTLCMKWLTNSVLIEIEISTMYLFIV